MIYATIRRMSIGYLLVLPVAWYPVIFVYCHNAAEASFGQALLPLWIFTGVAAVVYVFFAAAVRNWLSAVALSHVAMLIFTYYRPIERIVRDIEWHLRLWHILPMLVFALLFSARLVRSASANVHRCLVTAARAVAFVFGILLCLNLVIAGPILLKKVQRAHNAGAVSVSQSQPAPEQRRLPNVYYIILDEYSSFDMVKKHYGYDNSHFASFLQSSGFNVSYTSRNPSHNTSEVLSYLIGMSGTNVPPSFSVNERGFMSDWHPAAAVYGAIKSESRLTHFFASHGYRIYAADMYHLFFNNPHMLYSDVAYALGGTARTLSLANSILGIVAARSLLSYVTERSSESGLYNTLVEGILNWLTEPKVPQPVFVFAHILCPHGPFSFDQQGRSIAGGFNWKDKSLYLGQYIYITDRISSVVHSLVARDPDCVIILQSDHSARIWAEGKDHSDLPIADMTPILNAVYFQGEPLPIDGLSGLDTGLTVYRKIFGEVTPQ